VKKIVRIAVSQNSTRLPFLFQAGDPQKVVAGGCATKMATSPRHVLELPEE